MAAPAPAGTRATNHARLSESAPLQPRDALTDRRAEPHNGSSLMQNAPGKRTFSPTEGFGQEKTDGFLYLLRVREAVCVLLVGTEGWWTLKDCSTVAVGVAQQKELLCRR